MAQEQPKKSHNERLVGGHLNKISWTEWRHEKAARLTRTVQNGGRDIEFWALIANGIRKTCTL